jgi:plasmid stabilization system protein ParE
VALILTTEAQNDIENAVLWYKNVSEKVLQMFVDELDEYILFVKNYPLNFQNRYKNKKIAPLKKFPYNIVYEIHENDIVIIAVFHTAQNPIKIRKRKVKSL